MQEELLSPEQFAQIMRENKPYLINIEEEISDSDYGSVEVKLEVRAGKVQKWSILKTKTYLMDKLKT